MDTPVLDALPRESSQKAKAIRSSGKIPAVYYGRGQQTLSLQLDYQKFRKMFDKAGENTIIDLMIGGEKMPVLVHQVQYDPMTDAVAHVDLIHVDMQKEVTTSVKITIVGISPAVKNMGGILDVQKHEIKIKCLPKDLIHGIPVDVTPIVDFHTSIHVKDLKVPSTIKVLDNPEDTVVTATPIKIEVEEKPAETAAAPGAEGAAAVVPGAAPGEAAPAAGAAPSAAAPSGATSTPQAGAKGGKK